LFKEAGEEEAKRLTRLSAKPVPTKVERKPQKVVGKGKSFNKEVKTKKKKGSKGKMS
jgi:hypothetical protein